MALQSVHPRADRRHDVNQSRQEPDVITGSAFRRKLGWGKDRFSAALRAGRFTHLVAVNVSSRHRVVYVRAKVEAWLSETAPVALRASRSQGSRG